MYYVACSSTTLRHVCTVLGLTCREQGVKCLQRGWRDETSAAAAATCYTDLLLHNQRSTQLQKHTTTPTHLKNHTS